MDERQQQELYEFLDELALRWLDIRTSAARKARAAIADGGITADKVAPVERQVQFRPVAQEPEGPPVPIVAPVPTRPEPVQWQRTVELNGQVYVKLTELRQRLGVSDSFLYGLRDKGLLRTKKFGGIYYTRREVANDIMAIGETKPPDRKLVGNWVGKVLQERANRRQQQGGE